MTTAASLELAIVAGSIASGTIAAIIAVRARAGARADRAALQLALAREAAFVDASRRLADAARTSVDAVRDEIARGACRAAPNADGVLAYEVRDGALECVYAHGERMTYFRGSKIALGDRAALPARALELGHRATLSDAGTRPIHPIDAAAVAVPLSSECAVLVCAPTPLPPDVVDRLVLVCEQAAPAYHTARERETDRRQAEYDALTGLLTPRAFRLRLAALIDRARVVPHARLALLFVDTDRFKEWNDRYGHAAGDRLLRRVAGALRSVARPDRDLLARNGGDEFCVVFTETDKATAVERADIVRARIAALDGVRGGAGDAPAAVRITASIGVSAYPADAADANALLERADGAMYHSKRAGRDAVSYVGMDGEFVTLRAVDRISNSGNDERLGRPR